MVNLSINRHSGFYACRFFENRAIGTENTPKMKISLYCILMNLVETIANLYIFTYHLYPKSPVTTCASQPSQGTESSVAHQWSS